MHMGLFLCAILNKFQKKQLFQQRIARISRIMMILRRNIFFCDFCDFCVTIILDIAAQYRFSHYFAFSRIFAIPSHRGNGLIFYREKTAENTDLRENYISHRKHRIFIFEHGLHGLYGFLILRRNIFFCDF